MIFTRRKINDAAVMYGHRLEQVKAFEFLGVWFDTRFNWNEHINGVSTKV